MNLNKLIQPPSGPEARWVTQFRALMDPTPFHVQYGALEQRRKQDPKFYAYIAKQIVHDEAVISYRHELQRKVDNDPKRYEVRLRRYLDTEKLPMKKVKQQLGFYASKVSLMHALENAGSPYIDERRKQQELETPADAPLD